MISLKGSWAHGGDSFTNMVTDLYAGDGELVVGLPRNLTHPRTRAPLWKIAQWIEYGVPSKGIAPRPAINSMWTEKGPSYLRSMKARALAVKRGATTEKATMERLGDRILYDIKAQYDIWRTPVNRPSTVKKKGFDDPLIETRTLSRSYRAVWTGDGFAKRARFKQLITQTKRIDQDWSYKFGRMFK